MGGQESKPPPEYDAALAVFSTDEQDQIKSIFSQISGDNETPGENQTNAGFDSAQLQAYTTTLPQRLAYHLFSYMLNVVPPCGQHRQLVNYASFVVSLSHVMKGTPSERAQLVASLASGASSDVTTTTQIIRLIEDLMEAYRNTAKSQEEYTAWRLAEQEQSLMGFTNILLQGLGSTGGEVEGDTSYDTDTLERWISSCALLQHIMDTVFHTCFSLVAGASNVPKTSLLPQVVGAPWETFSTLLDLPSLVVVCNHLPHSCRSPWRLLFSDRVHGESFSTLLKHTVTRGPCILLIQDADGHVFGGFTGSDLNPKPQFSGDETSFLFSLQPSMQVYNVTGYNSNYLYLNRGQETMPNGLGMGGQLDYFGLWLDAEYGRGHSKGQPTCTTYGSPQLSASPEFTVRHLEVWGVGPDPALLRKQQETPPPDPPKVRLRDLVNKETLVKSSALKWRMSAKSKADYYTEQKLRIFSFLQLSMEGDDQPPTSILDKDRGAQALLEMINRPRHSEGLREPDPNPETRIPQNT